MSPPLIAPTDAEKLRNLEDLEDAAYDLANMAGLTWDILSAIFEGQCGPGQTTYTIDPGMLDRLHFAVNHTWDMARQFRDDALVARGLTPSGR